MTGADAGAGGPPPRVLVVEDTEANRDLVVQLLEDAYDVRCAEDGEAGLALARSWKPAIVLLDLGLPKLDGWSVARAIRDDPALGGVRVIALTAHAMPEDRDRALAAGCDHYLTKPIDDLALLALLAALTEADRP